MCVSKSVLEKQCDIALITLNPGGRSIPADQPQSSCENGVAYLVEGWGSLPGESKLQKQVQHLFSRLSKQCGFGMPFDELMGQSLIGYFVPFRSPRLVDLKNKNESFALGCKLWSRILQKVTPKLIFCIDRETHTELKKIIPEAMGRALTWGKIFPTGWGKYTADVSEFKNDLGITRLIRLPHLSTYQLFTSPQCERFVNEILKVACDGSSNL